ncbi:hypothetical protein QG516_20810 [Pedobacter gandavensis]|uniref:hypothetical protein n=1 Tax=Pedobacter gandavensis TaxID=2679963 RepID=UPI00247ABC21|nr:hypothetical protein [Pedobacter gandavensis]WGQ08957.1 hypothetical protein QG516_20810 [Pedobacter gandavensis]
MKNTSNSKAKYFTDSLVKDWDKEDGVNFAIALARISGWLIHVDWLEPFEGAPVELMKSLRVYVGTDVDYVFDFNGKKGVEAYNQYVVTPIAVKRAGLLGSRIITRFYSEEKLWELPLRTRPDEARVLKAMEIIRRNQLFIEIIPVRLNPQIAAHLAAEFSFDRCVVYAQALQDSKSIKAVAIVANKYTPLYGLSKLGYCHSIIIHPDGEAEDSFGKQPLKNILSRFGILEFNLDDQMQVEANENLKRNSPVKYQEAYDLAMSLISLV